jgi:hypothetical protein
MKLNVFEMTCKLTALVLWLVGRRSNEEGPAEKVVKLRPRMTPVAALAAVAVIMVFPFTASAFEGGGRKPSEAPLITIGQHYTGQLNNHKSDANYNGNQEVAFWRLPPVMTRDVFTVNWHVVPFVHSSGFPICMVFAQGADDYNWGSAFSQATPWWEGCDADGPAYSVSGSGTAQTTITANLTDPGSSYLEFFASADEEATSSLEPFPYDFTVGPILHYLSVSAKPVKRVSANGVFKATSYLTTGLPAPDGLPFNLAVMWADGGVASYSGVSSGGVVSFQLALPATAYGKDAEFVVSHAADGTYQAATAPKLDVEVAKPKPPAPTPCFLAERRARSLARRLKRLKLRARGTQGATRRALHRKANRLKNELRSARHHAESLCGDS